MNKQEQQTSFPICVGLTLAIAAVSFAFVAPAVAQEPILQIQVQNANLPAGSSGFVDVLISATADQSLSLYGAEFRITPDPAAGSNLSFLEETETYLSASNYVFFGNSAAQNDGFPSSAGLKFTETNLDDFFLVGDGTDDFSNVVVNETRLMARLHVQHDLLGLSGVATIDDKFNIDLVPPSGDSVDFLFNGNSDTGFASFGLDPLNDEAVPFESIPGMVTITEPLTTPEPATAAPALFALLGMLLSRSVRRLARRDRAPSDRVTG